MQYLCLRPQRRQQDHKTHGKIVSIRQVAYSIETAEDREIKSLISFAERSEGIQRLIIVTGEEERMITKGDVTIEVLPAYKFLDKF